MAVGLDTAALVAATSLHREWGSLDMEERGRHLARRHRWLVTTDMRGNAGYSWLLRKPHTTGARGEGPAGLDIYNGGTLITKELSRRVSAKMLKCYRYGCCEWGSRQILYAQITTISLLIYKASDMIYKQYPQ
jgi:hypothetical protein